MPKDSQDTFQMGAYTVLCDKAYTEQHRKELLELRAAKLDEEEILAVVSTSRSAWGNNLEDIHWDKHKDNLPLPQTKSSSLYSYEPYAVILPDVPRKHA